jgi:hypothetical protein
MPPLCLPLHPRLDAEAPGVEFDEAVGVGLVADAFSAFADGVFLL